MYRTQQKVHPYIPENENGHTLKIILDAISTCWDMCTDK